MEVNCAIFCKVLRCNRKQVLHDHEVGSDASVDLGLAQCHDIVCLKQKTREVNNIQVCDEMCPRQDMDYCYMSCDIDKSLGNHWYYPWMICVGHFLIQENFCCTTAKKTSRDMLDAVSECQSSLLFFDELVPNGEMVIVHANNHRDVLHTSYCCY